MVYRYGRDDARPHAYLAAVHIFHGLKQRSFRKALAFTTRVPKTYRQVH